MGLDRNSLTIDRVTSFTPFQSVAYGYGSVVLCVVLGSPDVEVFADFTTEYAIGIGHHRLMSIGDAGVEVQLMPGNYRLAAFTLNPTDDVPLWL
jgi:hypothetical protein